MRLAGKTAIVTGGASGMGQAGAVLFAQEGAKVAIADLDLEGAEATAQQIRSAGGKAIAVQVDVTEAPAVEAMVERTTSELGLPTVLFNNAGADTEGKKFVLDISEEEFDRAIEINLTGGWLVMKSVIPRMIAAGGGAIVNTASISALKAGNTVGYAAAKAGLLALTRLAAIEYGRQNIRVNAICPGATLTGMARKTIKSTEFPPGRFRAMSLFDRMARAEEMAQMALFLACEESSFATGAAVVNDGGWSLMAGMEKIDDRYVMLEGW
jgi:NAD(P)-dependent dehydrogenase (short-subunit alcohol dehydrogenase family)